MFSRWKPPVSCDGYLILNVRIEPCRPFWRSRPLLTRNDSRENSSGSLSRPGTATLCFMAALRARQRRPTGVVEIGGQLHRWAPAFRVLKLALELLEPV